MDATNTRDWTSLPIDLLGSILSHLFLADTNSFRSVCKTWKSVPSPPTPSPILCPLPQSPWLMFFRGPKPLSFYHPVYKGTYTMDIPAEISGGALVRFSKDGWLLMSSGERSTFFFNPFTRAKIDLPDLPRHYSFDGISFSSAPTSPDCTVFGVRGFYEAGTLIIKISRGENAWSWDKVQKVNGDFVPSFCNPVFHNEEFYCLGQDGKLGVFDPHPEEEEEELSWTVLAKPGRIFRPRKHPRTGCESYLMECDGKLLAVFVRDKGRRVSVYTLDEENMAWQKVSNLGNKMLFVSHTTSFSATKVVDGMENKIYFPRFCGGNGVFYSLENHRYEVFGNERCENNDFRGKEEQLHCSWIEPTTNRFSEEDELDWLANIAG